MVRDYYLLMLYNTGNHTVFIKFYKKDGNINMLHMVYTMVINTVNVVQGNL